MGAKLIAFFKKETILCVAGLLAVLSMAWIPPGGEYMGYINWQVLVLLFCLMSVMGGLQALGIFKAIANTLLHWANGLRQLTLLLVMLCFSLPWWSPMTLPSSHSFLLPYCCCKWQI